MQPPSDKLLIQKYIKKGDRIIPFDKKGFPIAVAMEDFDAGDLGVIDRNVTYPIKYNYKLVMLPGLKKIRNVKIIKRRRRGKKNVRRRSSSKKNKRIN